MVERSLSMREVRGKNYKIFVKLKFNELREYLYFKGEELTFFLAHSIWEFDIQEKILVEIYCFERIFIDKYLNNFENFS
jgi:hypothetical protein